MSIYFQDEQVTLHLGDSLECVATMADGSVDCIVTSPPYYGLRDYNEDGQYGNEDTPAEYVETMRALFHECRRVMAKDGTFWLNLGDSFSSHKSGQTAKNMATIKRDAVAGIPTKNLLGMPWRVALALQDDGWILRNDIIWHKPNAMPESVTDRMSCTHEHIFMFAKSQKYRFNIDPLRIPLSEERAPSRKARHPKDTWKENSAKGAYDGGRRSTAEPWNAGTGLTPHTGTRSTHEGGKNPGDVWNINTQPFSGAHFAVFPQELPRRAILAGCKPGGVVMDPFNGSGTTGLVAQRHGRKYVGVDLNADYLKLALETRLQNATLTFEGVE